MADARPPDSPTRPPHQRVLALIALLALLASGAWSSWAILTDRADFGLRRAVETPTPASAGPESTPEVSP